MEQAILDYIDERLRILREELEEAKTYGVNTPGFNQTLGAIDELKLLLDVALEQENK